MADQTPNKQSIARQEEEILAFWREHKIFEQSETRAGEPFVFYDGPPFATGVPHYGHLLQSTIKDTIPRYRTMCGRQVRRRWGWDCHGLPLENQIEEQLGIKTKRDIETLGVDKFNEEARKRVLVYADEWKKVIPRIGRWVDMEHDYKTMDSTYTESVWWSFKTLYDKGLIYKGFKAMYLCPRCGTTLSNFEVSLGGYKDIEDYAVTVKFPLVDEPGVSLLIWTTTPWTLPGNTAAAVHPDSSYVYVEQGKEQYIVAKELVEKVFGGPVRILKEVKGKELVGRAYTPPFDYFKDTDIANRENGWKVYPAEYVTLEDGTGIVHLAPAFGEEDLELARAHEIPVIHHVDMDGKFTAAVTDLAGLPVKPKGHHQENDAKVVELLKERGVLFRADKIVHAYPHCWRCETPLLNYAANSWFVKVTALKDQLVSENEKVHWVPEEIGRNRFGNWLAAARDWAISRARFWGAPLPVWESADGKERLVLGSLSELSAHTKRSGNTYLIVRHGQAQNNVENFVSSHPDALVSLTERGQEEARAAAGNLRERGVTLILTSPLMRARETAEIIRQDLGLSAEQVLVEPRLSEINVGSFEGKPWSAYQQFFSSGLERFVKAPEGGETFTDVRRRTGALMYELEDKYQDQTILLVGHETALRCMTGAAHGLNQQQTLELSSVQEDFLRNGEVRELPFQPLPHNRDYELDYHRPYIDEFPVFTSDGRGRMTRVPEVFDCWYESGSMPYAQDHYPFEKERFDAEASRGFPADFIAEALDQTRGWFYSLIVLGVGLFGRAPYRNVITTGLILGSDGQKMSKRLKNYPEVSEVVEKYGADALRYLLLSSPVVRGEDYIMAEPMLAEAYRKIVARLLNVLSFYQLYRSADSSTSSEHVSSHVLDTWVRARLSLLLQEVTSGLDNYELDRAARPIADFIEDLSVWYVRRSRERLKTEGDDARAAAQTLHTTLLELSKIIAPFMPFLAEHIYQVLRPVQTPTEHPESVHLSSWPHAYVDVDQVILSDMEAVRRAVTLALEARTKAAMKVRQPLAAVRLKDTVLRDKKDLLEVLMQEVNVKNVEFDEGMENEVELDLTLTDALREEGRMREVVRALQDLRKEAKLTPTDQIVVVVGGDAPAQEWVRGASAQFQEAVRAARIEYVEEERGTELELPEFTLFLSVRKV